jgi:predicted secreted Zn-dependent protease
MTRHSAVPAISVALALALAGGSALAVVAQDEGVVETVVEMLEASAEPTPTPGPTPGPTPKPSLRDGLPRKSMPEGPRFVGPATLKVSGTSGAYAWPEILFGAQEVDARVSLTPKGRSCAARVRLIEDGQAVVNEWFSVGSRQKEGRHALLDVDYLSGRLRIDSDCAAWSVKLTPRQDPDLEVAIKETFYKVRGDTIEELAAQTEHVEDEWAAFTEWHTSWRYWSEESDGSDDVADSCDVTRGESEVEMSIIYPRWTPPADADPAVVREWGRFMKALQVHELGHVTIALQGADAVDDRLDGGFSAATCADAETAAAAAATRIFDRYARASKRYDRETDHGLAQGTGLR